MPKYKYIVVNAENKQLNGTISGNDEVSARQELNNLGFSVISIAQVDDQTSQSTINPDQLPVFEFAGIDKNQKRVVGTIEAQDRFSAYKRLISEYAFEIEYVIDNSLEEKDKIKDRKKGAYDLQEQLDKDNLLDAKKQSIDEKDLQEFQQKQEVLKSQIEFVLNKVKEMLDLYEQQLKPETKEKIRQYVDKILRIKTSTNLDYIRKTAEELLGFLQKEEIFLNEEAQQQERTKMVLEAKSMMMQLRKGKSSQNNNFSARLTNWRKEMSQNPAPPWYFKLVNLIISPFIAIADNPEIAQIKADLHEVNEKILHYVQLYFQSPNEQFKIETKAGIKQLWQNRKNLKQKLNELKKKIQLENKKNSGLKKDTHMLEDLTSFTGWLVCFYLIYYFIALYAATKDLSPLIGAVKIPAVFYFYKSSFLKYFFCTFFLLHGSLSIKKNFFSKNQFADIIIAPIFLLSSIIIYLNF